MKLHKRHQKIKPGALIAPVLLVLRRQYLSQRAMAMSWSPPSPGLVLFDFTHLILLSPLFIKILVLCSILLFRTKTERIPLVLFLKPEYPSCLLASSAHTVTDESTKDLVCLET
ncbi:hypothetical protein BD289DRAFT_74536 [Coniella lustricola]|uniref:Uncharacterized protein n=1 Tax=Coniella lustricola TaxID=2025994 RepID=A0A2T3AHS9_9PEZI|nr:hypothetical protein BD289DRAFT_74536 [Coniella lustricola]